MKDLVNYVSAHHNYYSAMNKFISGYYLSKVRQIIQNHTNNLSVFHFASTMLIKEIDGISYYKVNELYGNKTAIINSNGEIIVPFGNYKDIGWYEDDFLENAQNISKNSKETNKNSLLKDSDNEFADKTIKKIIDEIQNISNTNIYSSTLKQKIEFWQNNQPVVKENTKLLDNSPYSCLLTNNKYSKSQFFTNERNKRFFVLKDKITQKCGLINAKGELIADFIWDDIFGFILGDGDFIGVLNNSKIGLIDCSGNVVVDALYDNVISFSDGLAAVEQNNKAGYINTMGEIVIPIIYEKAELFVFGKAKVTLNGETFYIDRNGKRIKE